MKDTFELPISTTAAGDTYNRALKAFLSYDADLAERVMAVPQADPAFALGHCLLGYVMMAAFSRAAVPAAVEACRAAEQHSRDATPRERAHVRALGHWIARDVEGALREWEGILVKWPRDALALQLVQANLFWLGRARQMRASLERVAPHWTEGSAGYPGFLSAYAFALEETGDYPLAERTGRLAVELDPSDVWGAHAVAHVLEMQRRPAEGKAWLNGLERHWGGKGHFLHHLSWHLAMFHLAQREFDAVLDLYDRRFRNLSSPLVTAIPDFFVDVQNAASMLMRLELRGVAVGDRWNELADKAEARLADHLSAWTVPHWMMALAGAGRDKAARSMLNYLSEDASPTVREVAFPVCEGLLAHRRGEYQRAASLLGAVAPRFVELGGSHAQRDVLVQVYADSARRAERAAA